MKNRVETANFEDYFRSIIKLKPDELDSTNFKDYLKIYYHNKKGFNDIKKLFATSLQIVEKYKDRLTSIQYHTLKPYFEGYLENREVISEFRYILSSVEMVILNELKYFTHYSQNDLSYNELEVLMKTQNMLYQIESTQNDVSKTLQQVGYRFLDEIESLLDELSPVNRNIVLEALKCNMQSSQAQNYYRIYKQHNESESRLLKKLRD